MGEEKYNRSDLINIVAEKTGLSHEETSQAVECLFTEMKTALTNGKWIELRGFGTFLVRQRKARPNARNPRTGERVAVEPRSAVVFKPGRDLKAGLRQGQGAET